MTTRSITDFPRNEAGLVGEFIGTAYDTVKKVYDNLPEIQRLDGVLTEIETLAIDTTQAALADALPAFQATLDQHIVDGEVVFGELVTQAEGHATNSANSAQAAETAQEAAEVAAQEANDAVVAYAAYLDAQVERFEQDGYVLFGEYAQYLVIEEATQMVRRAGSLYRPVVTELPFVTTGTWYGGDESLFEILSPDDALRQDLADPSGSTLVGHGSGTVADALDSLTFDLARIPFIEAFGAAGNGIDDDTAAFISAESSVIAVQLTPGKTYRVTSTVGVTTPRFTIIGNGALIQYDYEQSGSPTYAEALFYVDGADDCVFKGVRLEYVGTFDTGSDYSGLISGIHVENTDNFTADGVEAFGFNRAGINIATLSGASAYCKNPRVTKCDLHHNRVSGLLFGNTLDGKVENNVLAFNGLVTSVGTGYGFAGWSSNLPINTMLVNNQANDNYRKGLDFHAGDSGVLVGNVCSRNRVYGIYVMGVTGGWSIDGNLISDMQWANEFPTVSPYGIRVGNLIGEGTGEQPTSYTITGNTITKMNATAGLMFPLGDSMIGHSYGSLVIADNLIDVGSVAQIHNSAAGVTGGTVGNYFDVSITGNIFKAEACTSSLPCINIRSSLNRKKVFNNNIVEILAATTTGGIYSYDSTAVANRALVAVGNIISSPASGWSAVYDPINVRRVTNEQMKNNVVNGVTWRDWNGFAFDFIGTAAPATNFWSQGSKVWAINAAASGFAGWYCTVQGTPGTWKTFGAISA